MKKIVLAFIMLLFVISLFGQIFHSVYIEVIKENYEHPQNVIFYSWIQGRENEIVTTENQYCTYFNSGAYSGVLSIQCAEFASNWNVGDTLMVEIIGENSLKGNGYFVLNENNSQFFGDLFETWSEGEGITLHATGATIPDIDFSADQVSGEAPLTVNFTPITQSNINEYRWDFMHDTITDSNAENPSFTYELPGIYSVFLFVKSGEMFNYVCKNMYIIVNSSNINQNNILSSSKDFIGTYPNPFNPSTKINYSLSESGNITIDVFNLKGEFVTCLVNEYKQNGNYSLVWNGRDYNGKEIPSGTYIIKLNNNGKTTVTKCVLLK